MAHDYRLDGRLRKRGDAWDEAHTQRTTICKLQYADNISPASGGLRGHMWEEARSH